MLRLSKPVTPLSRSHWKLLKEEAKPLYGQCSSRAQGNEDQIPVVSQVRELSSVTSGWAYMVKWKSGGIQTASGFHVLESVTSCIANPIFMRGVHRLRKPSRTRRMQNNHISIPLINVMIWIWIQNVRIRVAWSVLIHNECLVRLGGV